MYIEVKKDIIKMIILIINCTLPLNDYRYPSKGY